MAYLPSPSGGINSIAGALTSAARRYAPVPLPSYGSPSALYGTAGTGSPSAFFGSGVAPFPPPTGIPGRGPAALAGGPASYAAGTGYAPPPGSGGPGDAVFTNMGSDTTPFTGYLTPDQLRAQAQAAVDAQYGYQQSELERQRQSQANYAATSAGLIGNIDAALADVYKSIGPAIQQGYQSAAQDTTGAAAGYSQGMRDAISGSASQANELLRALGAPEGNQVKDVSQNAGDVLYGLGGSIPAATLQQQGAAFGAAAKLLPGTAVAQGRMDAQTALAQGKIAQDQVNDQLRALSGQKGSSLVSVLNDLTRQQAQLQSDALTRKQQGTRDAWSVANTLSTQTGHIFTVGPDGQPVDTGQPTQSAQNATAAGKRATVAATATADYRRTQTALSQLRTVNASSSTLWVFDKKGKLYDTKQPQPRTLAEARQVAKDMSAEYGTVFRVNSKGQAYQPVDKKGNPLLTRSTITANAAAAATADYRTQQEGRQLARDATVGTGVFYQYNPKKNAIEPQKDSAGNVALTPTGRSSQTNSMLSANAIADSVSRRTGDMYVAKQDKAGNWFVAPVTDKKGNAIPTASERHAVTREQQTALDAFEKKTGYFGTVNPDGSIGTYKDPKTGKPVRTEPARHSVVIEGQAERRIALQEQSNALRQNANVRAAVGQAQNTSGWVYTVDKNGVPTLYVNPKTGKPVRTLAGQRLDTSKDQAASADYQRAWTRAQSQATDLSKSGVVFVPRLTKNGVEVVPYVRNGKPVLTTAEKARITKSKPKPLTVANRKKQMADIADSLHDAHNGISDNIVKTIENGKVVAKLEPVAPIDYSQAINDLIQHGYDPALVLKIANQVWQYGESDRVPPYKLPKIPRFDQPDPFAPGNVK